MLCRDVKQTIRLRRTATLPTPAAPTPEPLITHMDTHHDSSAVSPAVIAEHRALAPTRLPGTARVDVTVPDGADHTLLQIAVDDMPWLVASLRNCLQTRGHTCSQLRHPVLRVCRSPDGEYEGPAEDGIAESFVQAELEVLDQAGRARLCRAVEKMLNALATVNRSADIHETRLAAHANAMSDPEQAAFVRWLDRRQFVPFGAARVQLDATGHPSALSEQTGLLAEGADRSAWVSDDFLPPRIDQSRFDQDIRVFLCKAGRVSPLIRHEHADLLIVAEWDVSGALREIDCIVGLFVPGLQAESVNAIPWLRDRVSRVMLASNVDEQSYVGKGLLNSLRSLPRDMLIHNRTSRLLEISEGIASLGHDRCTRVFSSLDPLGRYWNCLVYLPSDVYSRDLRLTIERKLEAGLDAYSTSFESTFSSYSPLARLHFVLRQRSRAGAEPEWESIEDTIAAETTSWSERLTHAFGEAATPKDLISRFVGDYGDAFPADYRERYSIDVAVKDVLFIESQLGSDSPVISPLVANRPDQPLAFRMCALDKPVSLSDAIPLIENLGFRIESERPFEISRRGQPTVHMHVLHVWVDGQARDATTAVDPEKSQRVSDAFKAAWTGAIENDGFNRLIFAADLDWRQANILRALGKYALQTRAPFSADYMIDALVSNAHVARLLVRLFEERLAPKPSGTSDPDTDTQVHIESALDQVSSLDEDRILRRFMGTILAVLRTNHWCRDAAGEPRDYLSLKFDCSRVPELPLPRPAFEIFVSSAHVDGVHLRGGSVARGGLRWSDRRDDYRTEVLGLMKAQQVKNAVIVPVGSKGGFYVKSTLPDDRAAAMEIVLYAYRSFLSGLLDVTDNLDGTRVIPPPNVMRLDGDDPYLVVAADKGTATFSDHANAVATEYGFWLGDGFASGGSVGYDHKKMGITARGAWESVKRHFRGVGIDTQTEAFTVAGIGDMSGDVFGNGMMLSEHIRLVAAFDHRHVFIDPSPSTLAAHAERSRLFALPRSSWDDYDRSLISEGGGIWSRSEKSIRLSDQVREALGVDVASMTPDQLVSAIIAAPVDLLWNGGIGTYVKASTETHADASDRANDAVRVDAAALRCRVIGEGGNLGFTQRGRIEYSLRGGLMYTDAIDNSAGVDCSDHEVNIKILLNAAINNGNLPAADRDALLESMTDEVGTLVLADNYRQTGCIDTQHALGLAAMDEQAALMDSLEEHGRLDRAIEFLPDNEQLAERAVNGAAMTRPEIAVLVSYAKMSLYDEVLASELPDQPALVPYLLDYFPTPLRKRFPKDIATHRLAREIIATVVTNDTINTLGPTWVNLRQEEFGVSGAKVVEAFLTVRSLFSIDALTRSIDALDNRVEGEVQARLHFLVQGLASRATYWVLRSLRGASPSSEQIEVWARGADALMSAMPECLSAAPADTYRQRVEYFVAADVPEATAAAVAQVVPLSSALDIIEVANSRDQAVAEIATLYFELGEYLDLHWLRDAIAEIPVNNRLHARARSELRSDLHYQHRHLTADIALLENEGTAAERIDRWQSSIHARVARYRELLVDIRAGTDASYIALSLAINELHKLMRPR